MTARQIDKIKGLFFGQAIGDALGLGTEFLNKKQIAEYYPNGLSRYAQIIQDQHRQRWEIGDWTDDTDQFLCICDSIVQKNEVDELAFAGELYKWFKGNPMGIGQTVYKVVSLPQFTLYPHKAAELVWKIAKKQNASNGAIMRTSLLGAYEFWDYDKVKNNTGRIAKVTHPDSRCVGSCVVITSIISAMLNEDKCLDIEQLVKTGDAYDTRIQPYIGRAASKEIGDLCLDEPASIGYTLKAMAAGLWAYFNATGFENGILKVVNEGGDADTNASVAGSLLGAKFGFHAIPEEYIAGLINKDLLEDKCSAFLAAIKRSRTQQAV